VIVALAFGSTLRQEWEIAGLQLTYILVDAILLASDRLVGFGIAGSTELA
jgi:hypothetical protein